MCWPLVVAHFLFSFFFEEEEDKSLIYQGTRVDLCITIKKQCALQPQEQWQLY